jgi:hypothetical protein
LRGGHLAYTRGMSPPPFSTFRPQLVERFARQVEQAWADTRLPKRDEAVPHHCWECDDLWEWMQTVPNNAPSDQRFGGWYFWPLLGLQGVIYLLGPSLLSAFTSSQDKWDTTDLPMVVGLDIQYPSRQGELLNALQPRQRWCILKMLIWIYLERPDDKVFRAIVELRSRMGYHESWPRPRPHPQT